MFDVLADLDHVLAGCHRSVDLYHRRVHYLSVLHHDHRIGPFGDYCTRWNPHHLPGTNLHLGGLSHRDLPTYFQIRR